MDEAKPKMPVVVQKEESDEKVEEDDVEEDDGEPEIYMLEEGK